MEKSVVRGAKLVALLLSVVVGAESGPADPPIYKYDNYEMCKAMYDPGATFCIAKVNLGYNPVSNQVAVKSQPNLLIWSVCVQDCEQEMLSLSQCERLQFNYTKVKTTEASLGELTHGLENLITSCIANRLHRQHNASGSVHVEYCETTDVISHWVELLFLSTCAGIIGLTVYSSLMKDRENSEDSTQGELVQAFSIQRSWKNFWHLPTSKTHQDFRYIEGVRVLTCLTIVFMHTRYEPLMLPTSDPEGLQLSVLGRLGNIMTPTVVQVFFTMSGLLMAVNFLPEANRQSNFEWRFLKNKVINRLIRFLPVYVLWMLFTASVYGKLSSGPMAYHTLKAHSLPCRNHWWTNVLFVNNLPILDDFCMIHAWYLGADMQMFVAALGLLTLMWWFPNAVHRILAIATLGTVIILISVSYHYALDPIFRFGLNQILSGLMMFRWLRLLYMPGYTNLGSYLSGIIAGYAYVSITNGGYDFRDTKIYKIIRALSTSLAIAVPLTSLAFINVSYDLQPSIWMALATVIARSYVPFFVSVRFIEEIARPAGRLRTLLSKSAFCFLGKLCYIVYIVHYSIIKILYSRDDPNGTVDDVRNIERFVVATVMSFAVAFVIYLLVEQPMGMFLKAKLIRIRKTDKMQ
ncbi:regulator of hypoxia-inducible factor 1 isoform X2 [Aedes albopictus]|uniref:Acyltransferase 3 domain-containing protein n=1 Tax=Aedes albopictus TaxID=7160 RepID=A0ABM1Y2R3_AEDAL